MIRIGAVSYLNTKPLVHKLDLDSDRYRLSFDLPGKLADQLEIGLLDVALIPSVETFLQNDLAIVSDACIACRGPVWSVKLFSRCDLKDIRVLALDEGSRTSATLVKILLDAEFGVQPECVPLPIDANWEQTDSDAVLVIGDRAMKSPSFGFNSEVDLGQWWREKTGLPFVFAVWAARSGIDVSEVEFHLTNSRDAGLLSLESIARNEHEAYGLSFERCLRYFDSNLHFVLGPTEKSGLALFYEEAAKRNLVPQNREIVFH